jgi:hypothetical protein
MFASLLLSHSGNHAASGYKYRIPYMTFVVPMAGNINPLAPSDPYMGRTAQLTSRGFILNTYSINIRTEYFKCAE